MNWTELILCKNGHYQENTVKQSIYALYPFKNSILNLGRDLLKMPTIGVGFLLLFHKLEDPVSLEDKGLTNYLYFAHSP